MTTLSSSPCSATQSLVTRTGFAYPFSAIPTSRSLHSLKRSYTLPKLLGYPRSMATIGDVMTGQIVAVAPEDTLGEAAERMAEQGVGSAVVTDSGRLIGILTERDLMKAVAGRVHTSEARVREWMTADPITASEADSSDEAIRTMLDNGFRHLPVVAAGRTVGVVSLRELMRAALQSTPSRR